MTGSNENTRDVGEITKISKVPRTSQNKKIAEDEEREQGLTVRQRNAADLLSLGHSNSEIAEIIGVSRRQLSVWRRNPYSESEVSRLRAELWINSKNRLRGLLGKAVNVLEQAIYAGDTKSAMALLKLMNLKVGPPPFAKNVNELLEIQAAEYADSLIGNLPALDPIKAMDYRLNMRPIIIRELYEEMKESLEVPMDEEDDEGEQHV